MQECSIHFVTETLTTPGFLLFCTEVWTNTVNIKVLCSRIMARNLYKFTYVNNVSRFNTFPYDYTYLKQFLLRNGLDDFIPLFIQ